MRNCCTIRSRGDDNADHGFLSWFAGPAETQRDDKEECRGVDAAKNTDEPEDSKETSADVLRRHVAGTGGKPNMMVYSISNVPQVKRGKVRPLSRTTSGSSSNSLPSVPKSDKAEAQRQQEAIHVPGNTREGVDIETDYFIGKVLCMYRTKPTGDAEGPYVDYFKTKKRNWEVRVQGRFKRIPRGDMFVGLVQRDFNYNQAIARSSQWAVNFGMAMLHKLKYDLYWSWGDRCEAAMRPNAELSHCVTNCTAWDQIIRTPKGREPPDLSTNLQELGDSCGQNLMRNSMGLASYSEAVDEVFRNINMQDTYTMSFFGVSQVIDLVNWNFRFATELSMARFFEDCPCHITMYELEPTVNGSDLEDADSAKEKRHLESEKRYYVDLMFWSNSVRITPILPERYMFRSAAEELERFAASLNGPEALAAIKGELKPCEPERPDSPGVAQSNEGEGNQQSRDQRRTSSTSQSSERGRIAGLWEKLSQTLRWIPDYTCANKGSRRNSEMQPLQSRRSSNESADMSDLRGKANN